MFRPACQGRAGFGAAATPPFRPGRPKVPHPWNPLRAAALQIAAPNSPQRQDPPLHPPLCHPAGRDQPPRGVRRRARGGAGAAPRSAVNAVTLGGRGGGCSAAGLRPRRDGAAGRGFWGWRDAIWWALKGPLPCPSLTAPIPPQTPPKGVCLLLPFPRAPLGHLWPGGRRGQARGWGGGDLRHLMGSGPRFPSIPHPLQPNQTKPNQTAPQPSPLDSTYATSKVLRSCIPQTPTPPHPQS